MWAHASVFSGGIGDRPRRRGEPMNTQPSEDNLSCRMNVKCHPTLLQNLKCIAKNKNIKCYSTLVRMWVCDAVSNELKNYQAQRKEIYAKNFDMFEGKA